MKLSARTRALAVLAASSSLLLFAVPLAAPASAAVPQPGKCTKLTTKVVAGKINATLTGCTPVAATGGKGGGTFTSTGAPAGTLNITIKWAASKGTTKVNLKFANQKTRGKCAVGATRVKLSGQVTGGTGTALKTFKKGQPITGSVCNHPTKGFSIEAGSALRF
jgi:hypothetical protein